MVRIPNNPLSLIPLNKLEKIHYIQLEVIKKREKEGKIEGRKLGITDVFQATFLRDIFMEADKTFDNKPEDMLGLHYYVAALNALPLDKVRELEGQTAKEIKKRKEIYRQKIDAGNLDKLMKIEGT